MGIPVTDDHIREHKGLVHKLAQKVYCQINDPAISYEDLVSEGYIGLVKALESFDETSGNAFSTYAYPTILGYMRSLINRRGNWIRFPAHTVLLAQKISKLDLQEEAPQVIAQKLDQTVPYIEQALKYLRLRNVYSLDLPRRDSEKEEDDHHYLAKTEDDLSVTVVHDFLEKLPPKKRRILELAMQGYNRREIGKAFGISHQAVWSHLQSIKRIYERTYVKEVKRMSELTKEQYLRMRLDGNSRTNIQKQFYPTNPTKFYDLLKTWGLKEKDAEEAALDLLQAELKHTVPETPVAEKPKTAPDPRDEEIARLRAELERIKANNVEAVRLSGAAAEKMQAEIERLRQELTKAIGERDALLQTIEKAVNEEGVSKFERTAREIGALVAEKNAAYGDAFGKSGDFLRLLYPNGIQPEQYRDALCLIRIFDKLMRIATQKDAFGESPYRDIVGYGILGACMNEANKEIANPEETV